MEGGVFIYLCMVRPTHFFSNQLLLKVVFPKAEFCARSDIFRATKKVEKIAKFRPVENRLN